MALKIAIIGRPNVGKSTLFNRLAGKKLAIVDNQAGVTRDRRYHQTRFLDFNIELIDTPGIEEAQKQALAARMSEQSYRAVREADLVLFVLDGRYDLAATDFELASMLRKQAKPVIVVVNKQDVAKHKENLYESHRLALGEPCFISAEHGTGLGDLYEAIKKASSAPLRRPMPSPQSASQSARKDSYIKDSYITAIEGREIAKAGHDKAQPQPLQAQQQQSHAAPVQLARGESQASRPSQESFDAAQKDEAAYGQDPLAASSFADEEKRPEQAWRLAVIGRPNVGKSTFINKLLGEERLLTGSEAGITRDSIAIDYEWAGQKMKIYDTAGLRRKSRISERLEKLSVSDTIRAITFSELVILMIDAEQPFEKQDLQLADLLEREGRALVIAINKWDKVRHKAGYLRELSLRAEELLPQLSGVALCPISSVNGAGIAKLWHHIKETYQLWNKRIATGPLNRWLASTIARHPPPAIDGRRLKLKYITQIKARPPNFVIAASRKDMVPKMYQRYLVKNLRKDFGLAGIPIRLNWIASDNPYAHKAAHKATSKAKSAAKANKANKGAK